MNAEWGNDFASTYNIHVLVCTYVEKQTKITILLCFTVQNSRQQTKHKWKFNVQSVKYETSHNRLCQMQAVQLQAVLLTCLLRICCSDWWNKQIRLCLSPREQNVIVDVLLTARGDDILVVCGTSARINYLEMTSNWSTGDLWKHAVSRGRSGAMTCRSSPTDRLW